MAYVDMAEAVEAIQKLAEVITDAWNKVVEIVKSVFNALWESLKCFLKQTNPELFRLAYYHKKQRVRKKNQARLFKVLMRWIRYYENKRSH